MQNNNTAFISINNMNNYLFYLENNKEHLIVIDTQI